MPVKIALILVAFALGLVLYLMLKPGPSVRRSARDMDMIYVPNHIRSKYLYDTRKGVNNNG